MQGPLGNNLGFWITNGSYFGIDLFSSMTIIESISFLLGQSPQDLKLSSMAMSELNSLFLDQNTQALKYSLIQAQVDTRLLVASALFRCVTSRSICSRVIASSLEKWYRLSASTTSPNAYLRERNFLCEAGILTISTRDYSLLFDCLSNNCISRYSSMTGRPEAE